LGLHTSLERLVGVAYLVGEVSWGCIVHTSLERLVGVAYLVDPVHTNRKDIAALPFLGIFMMTDLAWQLANLVYVPYCSSDAHMGDSDHEVFITFTLALYTI
jgi:hypothetical protein